MSAPEAALPLLFFALALLFAALGGAAVVSRVFRDVPEDGSRGDVVLGLALPAGLVLAALPGWMLSALSGLPMGSGEIVPISIGRVVLPLAAVAILGALALWGKDLLSGLALERRTILPVALFFALFLGFLWLRFPTGDIRGTEKPMDLAVLSNLMTTSGLPLTDPWMSGERFPYYYFGTLLLALPARAARLAPEIAYNLIAALLPAITALALFAAVRARGGKRKLAVFGALLCVLGGTPDGLRQWLSGQVLPEVDTFWGSSRRVHDVVNGSVGDVITEWPLFTFRLADLHPHAMTLPILVAFAAVAGRAASLPGVFLDAVMAGAVLSANPWDLPAVLLILAAGNLVERSLRPAVIRSAATLGIAAVVLIPFLRSPRPRLHGITFLPSATTALEAFLHFGALLAVPALAFGIALVRSRTRPDESLLWASLFPAIGIFVAIATKRPALGLAVGFLLGVAWLLFREGGGDPGAGAPPEGAVRAGFLFAGCGAALAVVADVLVVADTYGEQLKRMNTIFKTWSAAWPLLCLGTALLLPVALSTRRARTAIRAVLLLALVAAAVHPLSALAFRFRVDGGTLDGLVWMSREMPGDRLAVEWLRRHARPDAVIAEATGNPYSEFGRIGVASGRPTLLGWANHENLWRAESGEVQIRTRQNDLQTLYLSMDPPSVLDVIKRWKIEFVVLGPLELKVFGPNAFPTRGGFHRVFEESGTAIYEPNP